ncbi:hydrolase-like protein [Trypanosoma theileri]|uniref:Hydrolase-like protein n=1 Tax=Trypanosoma theileri TaxID=67003 RepID=A0A1X0NT85_9TRYP|nr:hydrolase-like protein [Trypanosoma theileri]ORC87748.1 hydrolase-like protein [Trypanosoma theileri]
MKSGDVEYQQGSQENNPQSPITLHPRNKSLISHDTNTVSPNRYSSSSSFSCSSSSSRNDEKFADVGVCASTGVSIRLCYQTFGDRNAANGVVLLIMGLASPSLLWDGHFCTALAARGLYVIRFDNRDIGRSTFLTGHPVIPSSSTSTSSAGIRGNNNNNNNNNNTMNDIVEEWESNVSPSSSSSSSSLLSSTPPRSWFHKFSGFSTFHAQLAYASIMQGRHHFFRDVYTLDDMSNDCVGLLNALHIPQAHIVGMCMGGMIAQRIAIQHPTRVRSLALFSTHSSSTHARWPSLRDVFAIASAAHYVTQMGFDIPQQQQHEEKEKEKEGEKTIKQKQKEKQQQQESLQRRRPRDEEELTQTLVSLLVRFAGGRTSRYPINRVACERQVRRILRRSSDFSGVLRQYVALLNAPSRVLDLQKIQIPTIVLHGTIDPLVPYQNGKELAELIPHAKFFSFEGLGHVLHPALREEFVGALMGNMQRSREGNMGVKNTSKL